MFQAYRFQRDLAASHDDLHHEGQAFVLTTGTVQFRTPDRTWIMTPGRLCWIPPYARHGFQSHGPVSGLSIKAEAQACSDLPTTVRVLDSDPFHTALLRRMADRPQNSEVIWPVLVRVIVEDPVERLYLPAPTDKRLKRLASHLMQSPSDDRDLNAWALEIGMSPRTLMRRFQAETGLSFAVWRRTLRLLLATEMMEAGKSATEAALSSGFTGSSAFSAAFRQQMGLSPTAYLRSRVSRDRNNATDMTSKTR